MGWTKGKKRGRKTGGRKKGGPATLAPGPKSPALREMVLQALEGAGGAEYLERIARSKNPSSFLQLIGRLLPTTLEGKVDIPTTIVVVTGFDSGPPEA